jgi:hypothetical protein
MISISSCQDFIGKARGKHSFIEGGANSLSVDSCIKKLCCSSVNISFVAGSPDPWIRNPELRIQIREAN